MLRGLAGVYGISRLGKSLVSSVTAMDKWRREFAFMWKDAREGSRILEESLDLANMTILPLDAVLQARKQMKLFGIEGVENLKAFAGAAQVSGVGINSLVEAIGRIKTGGVSTAMRTLRRLGIGTVELEARGIKFKGQQIVSPADKVLEAVTGIIRKRFSGAVDDSAKTFESAIGTLQTQWTRAMSEMGRELEPLGGKFLGTLTGVLDRIIEIYKPTKEGVKAEGITSDTWREEIRKTEKRRDEIRQSLKDAEKIGIGRETREKAEADIRRLNKRIRNMEKRLAESVAKEQEPRAIEPSEARTAWRETPAFQFALRQRQARDAAIMRQQALMRQRREGAEAGLITGAVRAGAREQHIRERNQAMQLRQPGAAGAQTVVNNVDNKTINNFGMPTAQMSGIAQQGMR
jgi:hypothetical protein